MPPPRPHFDWHLRTRTLELGHRSLIMGILNITPDSFSDGGLYYSPVKETGSAFAHFLHMVAFGADIIDLGSESTRPDSTPITAELEQSRILPVVASTLAGLPSAVLSIDTYHASTARAAILAGAEIVNDVSGGLWDPDMLSTCAELDCAVILTHTRGRPHEWSKFPPLAQEEVMPLILAELNGRLEAALAAGIAREKIVLDPGLGFGKIGDANYTLLAHLAELHSLNQPILVGASRKRFLRVTPSGTRDNLIAATAAAHTAAVLAGAHILRVHDVRPAVEAAAVTDRILAAR